MPVGVKRVTQDHVVHPLNVSVHELDELGAQLVGGILANVAQSVDNLQ